MIPSKPASGAFARAVLVLLCPATLSLLAGCPGSLSGATGFLEGGDASPDALQVTGQDAGAQAQSSCPDVPTAVLAPTCGASGCHASSMPADALDLVSPGLAGRLVARPATGGPGLLVDPTNPAASVLYTKLQTPPPYGSRMPVGGSPLDGATIQCVLTWIGGLASPSDAAAPAPEPGADATASAPDVGSPSWTPASSASTVLWLDASQNVTVAGGVVTGWKDLSTYGNDAAQSNATTAPSLDPTGIHGKPALRFDETKGTFLSIPDSTSLQWGTGGYLVALVASNSKATAGRGHGGGVSTAFAKPQQSTAANPAVEITVHFNYFTTETTDDDSFFNTEQGEGEPGVTSTTTGYNDGTPRLYLAQVDTSSGSTAMNLRVNGAPVGSSSGDALVDVTLAGSPVNIGSTYGQSVEGEIAEVVAMRGTVSAADLASLEAYLMTKYALQTEGGM